MQIPPEELWIVEKVIGPYQKHRKAYIKHWTQDYYSMDSLDFFGYRTSVPINIETTMEIILLDIYKFYKNGLEIDKEEFLIAEQISGC